MAGLSRWLGTPGAHPWLAVKRLSRRDWRISDSRPDHNGESRLLGYIERLGLGRYEVMWSTNPPQWAYVPSFRLALALLDGDTEPEIVRSRERDKSIPLPHALILHRVRRRHADRIA